VIRAVASAAGISVTGSLPAGTTAYLDGEWVPPGRSGVCPAVVATPDGEIRWSSQARSYPLVGDVDTSAATALLLVAREVAEAIGDAPAASVYGSGALARLVRELVANAHATGPADVVIDTTGDPAVLTEACMEVADLGTIVLAGEALGRPLDLDVYPDVHRRGLRIVGVAPPLTDGPPSSSEPLPQWLIPSLCRVVVGQPLPAGALWYGVSW
jgi:hypothetical protein